MADRYTVARGAIVNDKNPLVFFMEKGIVDAIISNINTHSQKGINVCV